MKEKFLLDKNQKVHFVGVGGVSMSGLALHLRDRGFTVSGSDVNAGDSVFKLEKKGVKVFKKHSSRFVRGADAVVYSSAISSDNPEINYAKRKNIPLIKRSELVGEILGEYNRTVAVSGSHGKTTATAMIAQIFICAGLNPTVFLGGDSVSFGNYRLGGNQIAVAEACEYKRNFLDIKPSVAVVLNIDKDHMDAYKNMDDLVDAFGEFIKGGVAVINADDNYAKSIQNQSTVTFGINENAVYTARKIKYNGKGYSFIAHAYGRRIGEINLSVIGKHNVYNALASIAVADILGVNFEKIKQGLESYLGVKRRGEYLGKFIDKNCFADYAHHPAEIKATLNAFNDSGKDYAVVFQPHTYSRTEKLMQEFVLVLKGLENLIIYKTYPAREKYSLAGSESVLFDNIYLYNSCAKLAMDEKQLKKLLDALSQNVKRIIFVGAGDIYQIAKDLLTYRI